MSALAVPIGDALVREGVATLWVSDQLAAWSLGGRTHWVQGSLYLTEKLLAFRDLGKHGHRQNLTIPLSDISAAGGGKRWLGLLGGRDLEVTAALSARSFRLRFRVAAPSDWCQDLQNRSFAPESARQVLDAALAQGIRDRARYSSTLKAIRFPTLWGTSEDELLEGIRRTVSDLELPISEAYYANIGISHELIDGCEDYEMEEWAAETIRVASLANDYLSEPEDRRFHLFGRDVPEWGDEYEPVILLLTDAQRQSLLNLGVLKPST